MNTKHWLQDTRYAEALIENIDKTIKENQLKLMLVLSDPHFVEAKMIKIKEKYKKLKIDLIKKSELLPSFSEWGMARLWNPQNQDNPPRPRLLAV